MLVALSMVLAMPISLGAPTYGSGKTSGLTAHEIEMLGELDSVYAWEQFANLCSMGQKVAGSPEETAAQQYVYDQFKGMPMDEVWWESFPVAFSEQYPTTMTIDSNGDEPIQAVTYGDAPSVWGTNGGKPYYFGNADGGRTLTAPIVDAGYGTSADFLKTGNLNGAIALVHRDDDMQGWPNTPAIEAGLNGASAVVFYGYYAGMDNPEGIKQDSVFSPIPALSISPISANHIKDLLAAGPVTMTISGRLDFHPNGESHNVAAVMWGTTKPDEYIVISGHIDTWWEGANDDTSSIAAVLEYARLFSHARADGKFVNERTIVFVSCGAEETGGVKDTWYNWLVGSYEFVQAHPEIMAGLVVDLNLDGVSLPKVSGKYWAENTWELNSFVQSAITDLGIGNVLGWYNPIWSWTDAWSFGAKGGGSTVQMISWEAGYDWIYHTQLDTIEVQSQDVLNMVLKLYILMATRATHALVIPVDMVPTTDWAAGYLVSEKAVMPASEGQKIDAALASLATLRADASAANAYGAAISAAYEKAKPSERGALEAQADALNHALIEARRIVTPWTLGEGGTMGSWDTFLRSDQHAHDYKYVSLAIGKLTRNSLAGAATALEGVYGMEWGKYFSLYTYQKTLYDMQDVFMYWGDDFDQQQAYIDVGPVYHGLRDGSMNKADALAQLTAIRDTQLLPWYEADLLVMSGAWTQGGAILAAAAA